MPSLIESYIEYLRNISRKIISRSNFINVLPAETNTRFNYFYDLTEDINWILLEDPTPVPREKQRFYRYNKLLFDFLKFNSEKKLFVGSGLICGYIERNHNRRQYFCAPLMYGIVDIETEDDSLLFNIDFDSFQLNHDLISKLFDLYIEEQFDDDMEYEAIIPDHIVEKYNNIDIIEKNISTMKATYTQSF